MTVNDVISGRIKCRIERYSKPNCHVQTMLIAFQLFRAWNALGGAAAMRATCNYSGGRKAGDISPLAACAAGSRDRARVASAEETLHQAVNPRRFLAAALP